jgi:drug/metabolite transporter (DMT)-like permease
MNWHSRTWRNSDKNMTWFYLALLSAVASAAASICEKKVLFLEDPLAFSMVLAQFNLLLCVPFFFTHGALTVAPASLGILSGKTLLNALAFLCVMRGLKQLEISSALPLLVLTPGLVAVSAFVVLHETLQGPEIAGMGLLLGGVYLLQTGRQQRILEPFVALIKNGGYRSILIALLIFTVTALVDKVLVTRLKVAPYSYMAWQHLFLAIIFAVLFLAVGRTRRSPLSGGWQAYGVTGITALCTIAYRFAEIKAVQLSSSVALVLTLKRTSVFMAAMAGGVLFREERLLRKTGATCMMIAGALLIEGQFVRLIMHWWR